MNDPRVRELFGLDGKTALVTGGSRGIGKMIAATMLDAGAAVYLTSRDPESAAEVALELGEKGSCFGLEGDVSTPEGCNALAEELESREDSLHILVNNAGATWGASLEDHPVEAWDKVMDTNVRGTFLLTQQLLPLLRAAATPEDPARVINIGSVDGLLSPEFESYGYSSSKAAVHMLTRHLARHLATQSITVNAIAPGLFESKMTRFVFNNPELLEAFETRIPLGRPGEPDDIGGTAVWLSSKAGRYLTGAIVPVSGGIATL